MGWEYHNRKRHRSGKYVDFGRKDRLSVRCREDEKERIRNFAYAQGMDVSEYVLGRCLAGIPTCAPTVADVKGCIFDAARETLDVPPAI